jgi:hypothetical protein
MHRQVHPMRSHAIWNRTCALFGFGVILGSGHIEAGTVLTVDFSPGQTFQTTGSFIDESGNVPRFGTARGAVDATLDVMRATDTALPPRDPSGLPNGGVLQVNTFLTDTYHLHGSNTGSTVVPVHLTADGTMTLPGVDAQSDANDAILVLHPSIGGPPGLERVSLEQSRRGRQRFYNRSARHIPDHFDVDVRRHFALTASRPTSPHGRAPNRPSVAGPRRRLGCDQGGEPRSRQAAA